MATAHRLIVIAANSIQGKPWGTPRRWCMCMCMCATCATTPPPSLYSNARLQQFHPSGPSRQPSSPSASDPAIPYPPGDHRGPATRRPPFSSASILGGSVVERRQEDRRGLLRYPSSALAAAATSLPFTFRGREEVSKLRSMLVHSAPAHRTMQQLRGRHSIAPTSSQTPELLRRSALFATHSLTSSYLSPETRSFLFVPADRQQSHCSFAPALFLDAFDSCLIHACPFS